MRFGARGIWVSESASQVNRNAADHRIRGDGQVNWRSGGSLDHIRECRESNRVGGPHPVVVPGTGSKAGILISGDVPADDGNTCEENAIRRALDPEANGDSGICL